MNKECVYVDEKIVVSDENGNNRIIENSDKINEILVQENVVEAIEEKTLELKEKLIQNKVSKHFIPENFLTAICGLIISDLLFKYVFKVNILTDLIIGPFNAIFLMGGIIIPAFSLLDVFKYFDYKQMKKEKQGDILEYNYLSKKLEQEKSKLEELKKEQVIIGDPQEFKVEKVDDFERLKELRNKLSLYNRLGYNMNKYYRYYQAGKLEKKLSRQYDESSISEIKEYFETKDSSLVKKKCRKK